MDKGKLLIYLFVVIVVTAYILFLCQRLQPKELSTTNKFVKQPGGRILCFVLTRSHLHKRRALHVKNTWGKRCDKLIFMSNYEDKKLNAIDLSRKVRNGRKWLWKKTIESLKYIYEHHLNEVDWILKADDDTYTFIENLRGFLSFFNSDSIHYFGGILQYWPGGRHVIYNSGGAGYVLSRACLKAFINEALPKYTNSSRAKKMGDNQGEDIELAMTLKTIGIQPEDTRDERGDGRFFQFAPERIFSPDVRATELIWRDFWRLQGGISKSFVTFHYINPRLMYLIDWILHQTKPV